MTRGKGCRESLRYLAHPRVLFSTLFHHWERREKHRGGGNGKWEMEMEVKRKHSDKRNLTDRQTEKRKRGLSLQGLKKLRLPGKTEWLKYFNWIT